MIAIREQNVNSLLLCTCLWKQTDSHVVGITEIPAASLPDFPALIYSLVLAPLK